MNEKMAGKIKWFKPEKGYGYIKGYDEDDYYFEIGSLMFDIHLINSDLIVKFTPNFVNDMLYADGIEIYE